VSVVVTRAPLRVAFGGGGTDLPSYFREHGGFVVSAAIDRYVLMLASTALKPRYVLKHLELEQVERPGEVQHPILRAALERHWRDGPLELASVADVPPGTGLGSSGAYTVCTLRALDLAAGRERSRSELAEAACELEIDVLERTVGKQDQYAAVYGGVHAYSFERDNTVAVRRLELAPATLATLRDELLLFYTGRVRSAAEVLSHQVSRTLAGDQTTARNLARTKKLARESCTALERGELEHWAAALDEQWLVKRERAPGAVPAEMEELRALAKRAGARAVSLTGAGGGGFLLVLASDPTRIRSALEAAGLPELRFDIDDVGCVALAPPPPA
jgi:D-glycero-alpha-D-manno-heptose-7-phosphate kinase